MQDLTVNTPEISLDSAASHEEHPDLRVFGLLTFLLSESLMFGGFFASYLYLRGGAAVWPPEGTEVELLVPTINTIILVSSSFVIHLGDTAIKKNNLAGMRLWYGITALMGAIFLGGQVYEYLSLGYGLTTNVFANCSELGIWVNYQRVCQLFLLDDRLSRFTRIYRVVVNTGRTVAIAPSRSLLCN